ncbi:putative disease resistance protein RGA4 [Lolium rigidum]|uniref:putative disease resistance protein RGA4 n=1 Tax=Lolium rigidum TaxID=89674 RepID=UPI001F5D7F2B|nr:putative disease resistance protein RGA4 [Lolium rigidum]XP_047046903.1 putative disease resistance protein RGA4 [Lolium rigidum]XP_047046904.1 putative disease resistance protein RGA4 [Lolium rigidum]XP_047046905.1 putative disease resistance protein RGA4 [Lolium rigidum]
MAELVVSMAIGPLMSMLKDKVFSYLLDQYKVMEGMEEQHKILKRKLPAILDVITDAEEQATAHREGAKAWLQELKTVAYEANEVFDEFNYEALRREAKKKGHYAELGVDAIKLFPTHNRVVFRHRMASKLSRVLQAVEVLIAEMHAFRFKYRPQPPVSKQWRQTDYFIVDPHDIVRRSRDKDKRNIVDTLLRQANNVDLTVVPIVGMGGLGKTTLAQLIYNEHEIQKHFQLLLWICVSDSFDVNSLAKCIVEASPKKNDDTEKSPLDRLQKLLSAQRYLLVLDDVWNREIHKWDMLKMCLQHGGTGSAVLTTTRDKQVAEIMGANTTYNLNVLDDSFIKEIIEARAFTPEKEKPTELVELVGEIVKRCCGSPLAATALGSVLRAKTSVEEWKAVSCSSSICTNETGILPILKLSYNDLPSYMKLCFAFCAVFPKDYKIDVEKLIQLWIANGFVPEHNETNGRHIFNELASRSFFLDIEKINDRRKDYSRTICKIHDLMHDIAMSVMEKECVVASERPNQPKWFSDTVRHLFLSCEETEGILNGSMEKRSPAIQTLLCDSFVSIPLQHLSKYSSLHALKLRTTEKSFVPIPKYLHKLRYLDLSNSDMEALPEDISILYNLQVLDVSNCCYLARLPRQMKYMTSLRHLYTHGCRNLESMPPELGKLTKLQTLTYFIAADTGPDCSDVTELEHLNLGGQLELRQVENVREAEAKVANLGKKKNLKEMRLRWTSVSDSKVLSNFEPHDGLQVLKIYSYGGKCMGMLQNMVEIHLFQCERLQVLFRCGTSFTFPKLKELRLEDLLDLERWWEINERQEGQIVFPVLEKLFIKHCGKLITLPEAPLVQEPCSGGHRSVWSPLPLLEKLFLRYSRKLIAFPEAPLLQESCGGFRSAFPALQVLKLEDLESFQRWDVAVRGEQILFPLLVKLSIQYCPKLMDLPEAPKLSVLKIEDGKQEIFQSVDRYVSSLTKLILRLQNTKTTSEAKCTVIAPVDINEKWFQKSPLTFMELGCCNSFFGSFALELWDYFIHLEYLSINRCDVLVHWPEKVFQSLISLKILRIRRCKNLTGYAQIPLEPSGSEPSQHLPRLEVLRVYECESLVEMFNVPASLKVLLIHECDKLESIFSKKQQGMSELVQGSSCIGAITRIAVSELSPSPMNHFCPCLESLNLVQCGNLPAVLNLPPSLKFINICACRSIQVLSCQLNGPSRPQVSASINALPPYLRCLLIWSCDMLGGILRLPTSLTHLDIKNNSGFTSLESPAGEPPSLEVLNLNGCSSLASLPNEPHAYRFLKRLYVTDCHALKKLPRCLQQQLGSIKDKRLDAQYEVMAFNPKTWKEIPKMVRERRKAKEKRRLERKREQRRQADLTIEIQEA